MPDISGLSQIAWARGSITRAIIKGENGHPWPVPLEMRKGSVSRPEVITLALGDE